MSQAFMKFLKIIFRFIADGVIEIGFRLQSTSAKKIFHAHDFNLLVAVVFLSFLHLPLKKSYALTVKKSF